MIGKTNSQTGGAIKGEKLNISLKTNQTSHDDLIGAIITVTHPGGSTQYTWEGYEITVDVPPYVEYSVEYSDVEGYATPASFSSTAIEDNSRTLTAEYKTTVITASIGSNQTDKTDVADATITIGGKALKNGQSAKFATGSSLTATFSAVTGYATPASQNITASGTAMTVSGTYNSTFVTVAMADNQSSLNDIANATATVAASGITTQTVSNGGVVKVPTGVSCTVTWSALTDYKTPAAQTFTTSGAAVTKTGTYQTEVVSVTLNADDGSSVNGAVVTINGVSHTWNGTTITQKVAFGATYSVSVGDLDGYATPDAKEGLIASEVTRNLTFTYVASALKVNITSNQGADADIAAVKAVVAYGSTSVEVSDGQTVEMPSGVSGTVTFPEVEGYLAPEPVAFTHTSGLTEISGEYKCEKLTVNVSADEGSVSGYEVTVETAQYLDAVQKYKRISYIKSDGRQFIYLSHGYSANTRIEMKGRVDESGYGYLFGGTYELGNDGNLEGIMLEYTDEDKWKFYYGSQSSTARGQGFGLGEFNIEINSNVCNIDFIYDPDIGNEDHLTITVPEHDTINQVFGYPSIFGGIPVGSMTYGPGYTLYSYKQYEGDTIVVDLIPALRESDGRAGLYDAVTGDFLLSVGNNPIFLYDESSAGDVIATQTSATGTYKIPFGTSYAIEASDVSGFVTPSVQTFIADANSRTVGVVYQKITHTGTTNPTNGVYIQDTDGYFHTESEWDGSYTPNGVAVITSNCRFVMALEDAYNDSCQWGGYGETIGYVTTTTTASEAMGDYDGEAQTFLIVDFLNGKNDGYVDGAPAAEYCSAYTFPNGKKGYLGAAGEWQAVLDNKASVESALSKCGGTVMSYYYWTSTQFSSNGVWCLYWSSEFLSNRNKSYTHYVRAFAAI